MQLTDIRRLFVPRVPAVLAESHHVAIQEEKKGLVVHEDIAKLFPHSASRGIVRFSSKKRGEKLHSCRVGVVFSGGQAPGGHNVIAGLFDALHECAKNVVLLGFLGGPRGIIENRTTKLTKESVDLYRGQGGFDLLGSDRTKIETQEQLQLSLKTVQAHELDALVIIGGDDSNTNAAILAEYFYKEHCTTAVVGVPKTIDGDLQSKEIEISFGFDTATKVYSELIGNIARDALSAKKYYHFIKLMGRSASHIALECALRTKPNLVFISEEVRAKKLSLKDLKKILVELVQSRAKIGKNYGVILIPEGLIEGVPELKHLLEELAKNPDTEALSAKSAAVYQTLPVSLQAQLLGKRDQHGNMHVSSIETEQLLLALIQDEVSLSAVTHFLGYEGRSAFPSNFDCHYSYALGKTAAILGLQGKSGYIASLTGLKNAVEEWQPVGVPITELLTLEMRKGVMKPVIEKALVDLKGPLFKHFQEERESWALADCYEYPGPVQFFGPLELTDSPPLSLVYRT